MNRKIAIAGTGYVGLSLAVLLAQKNQVTAVDIIPEKVEMINNKKSPIQDDYIEKYLAEKELNLVATTDGASAYKAGYRGQIDIDIFDVNGEYYISEVNPRFGGGYPHAYECGVNHMRMIINNLCNKKNNCYIGKYEEGRVMMKYNELKIIEVK